MNLRASPNKITKKVLIQAFARSSCDSKVFFVIQVFGWPPKSVISLRFPIFVKKSRAYDSEYPILL